MVDPKKVDFLSKELQQEELRVAKTWDHNYNYLLISVRDHDEVVTLRNKLSIKGYSLTFEVNKDVTLPATNSYPNYLNFTYPGDGAKTSNGLILGFLDKPINFHKGEIWMFTNDSPWEISIQYVGSLWSGSIIKDTKSAFAVKDNNKVIKSIVKDGKVLTMGKIQLGSSEEWIDVHSINFLENGPIKWEPTITDRIYDTSIKIKRYQNVWFTFAIDGEKSQKFFPIRTEKSEAVTFGDKTFTFQYNTLINKSTYEIFIYLFIDDVNITEFTAYVGTDNL